MSSASSEDNNELPQFIDYAAEEFIGPCNINAAPIVARKSKGSSNTRAGPSVNQREFLSSVAKTSIGSSSTADTRRVTRSVAKRALENSHPETNIPKKRKCKLIPRNKIERPPEALYDEKGIHIATSKNQCDCMVLHRVLSALSEM